MPSHSISFRVRAYRFPKFFAEAVILGLGLAVSGYLNAQPLYSVTTLAGRAGLPGSADGVGNGARFSAPRSVAVDYAGYVYVTDLNNDTIRKISPTGTVSTLAGQVGNPGSTDGTGQAARFNQPAGIAVDSDGNVYVSDFGNSTIRKITPSGVVSTLAGQPGASGNTDGAGLSARFNRPYSLALDGAGNIYVADTYNSTIRKITAAGFVSTLAGQSGVVGAIDGVGPNARFFQPNAVAADSLGNVYVADSGNQTIRRITPAGVVSTLAGQAGSQASVDGSDGGARFNAPVGIAVDNAGVLYVADYDGYTIRRVTPAGLVSTIAGLAGNAGATDGSGSNARFQFPIGVAVSSTGNIYVADSGNSTIRLGVPTGLGVPTVTNCNNPLSIVPNGGLFTNHLEVALCSTNPIGEIRYTLDGTPPATNSILYTGPFTWSSRCPKTFA